MGEERTNKNARISSYAAPPVPTLQCHFAESCLTKTNGLLNGHRFDLESIFINLSDISNRQVENNYEICKIGQMAAAAILAKFQFLVRHTG